MVRKQRSRTPLQSERATYAFLVESGEAATNFQRQYALYRAVESVLVQRCASRESFADVADNEGCGGAGDCPADLARTFQVPGGAALSLSGAIGLVNKYCASLPSDVYSQLVPTWWLEKREAGVICHLKLPMNSPMNSEVIVSTGFV